MGASQKRLRKFGRWWQNAPLRPRGARGNFLFFFKHRKFSSVNFLVFSMIITSWELEVGEAVAVRHSWVSAGWLTLNV